ncbi:uncharacterized protein B0H18DRAFT_640339 [Fomitopsis serialis]|uniref:uncharacterized protein n=1 Tax=Fomitopsis serialis TaxID=139415 RepID=UPI002007B9A4|nr:uncharacterized protein B0H18DRAFT_640339 [Neoantrodia serialis]KAH9905516.1 hypothetical protein B0H18DRAFT_640339 [Neoantrodia serialis]
MLLLLHHSSLAFSHGRFLTLNVLLMRPVREAAVPRDGGTIPVLSDLSGLYPPCRWEWASTVPIHSVPVMSVSRYGSTLTPQRRLILLLAHMKEQLNVRSQRDTGSETLRVSCRALLSICKYHALYTV